MIYSTNIYLPRRHETNDGIQRQQANMLASRKKKENAKRTFKLNACSRIQIRTY